MRSFKLAAILVSSVGVSSSPTLLNATVVAQQFRCAMNCVEPLANEDDVTNCLLSIVQPPGTECVLATVRLEYEFTGGHLCPLDGRRLLSAPVPKPTQTNPNFLVPLTEVRQKVMDLGKVDGIRLSRIDLGHLFKDKEDCSWFQPFSMTSERCSGEGVLVKMEEKLSEDGVALVASAGAYIELSNAILATWEGLDGAICELVPVEVPSKQKVQLIADMRVEPSKASLHNVSVTFNDGCQVQGCAEVMSTPAQVQYCLNKASKVVGCNMAIYERTFQNVESDECRGLPHKAFISLHDVFAQERAIRTRAGKTSFTRVLYSVIAKSCGAATLHIEKSCNSAISGDLDMVQEYAEGFVFTGDQEVDLSYPQGLLLLTFEEQTDECSIEVDRMQSSITAKTVYTIQH